VQVLSFIAFVHL